MPKILNDSEKLDSVFTHIESLQSQLKTVKESPHYTGFQENKYTFADAEKALQEEINQYSTFTEQLKPNNI